ncbi:inhibitor of Bruton tyrosine kinase-like [Lytechinus pictus]|uniref:inhibitor of Bruton tyrosine kinase-like n=1 Tax=Lytechinus pictus TaxID=7653 RepID=UPI0030B9E081
MEHLLEWECTPRCRSQEHGRDMTAVITCGTTHQIQTFILSHCLNPFFVSDFSGRNLLHVAASCGKLEIVEWLLAKGADCRVRDKESGWTPLHRSLFFGQISCAISLIRHGASLKRYDKDELTPLELVMKDKPAYVTFDPVDPTQAYSWGTNSNFNLGHGRQRSRDQPELVDSLAADNHSIKQVVMCKFHTLFLTHQGRVLVCGHGQGGRLGLGDEATCLRPQLLKSLGARCKMVAAARDHSVFLMDSGNVMSCGENTYLQLGHSTIGQKCLIPKTIGTKSLKNKEIRGIAAGRFHTVIYTREAVFTLGLNAGQLGHYKGEKCLGSFHQVTSLSHPNIIIEDVVTSDAATVCLTKDGDIYVLHEYQCRKVASNHLSLKQLAVIGGHLNAELAENVLKKQGGEELHLLALHSNGKVTSWRKSDNSWRRCVWTHRRQLSVTRFAFNEENMLFVTSEGEGFRAKFISAKKNAADIPSKPTTEKGSKDVKGEQPVGIERLPLIHRATGVSCDPQGANFVVLQSDPRTSLTELPELSGSEIENDFKQLMVEADSMDLIHDVLIKIANNRIAAHKYILAHGSEYFNKIFTDPDESSSENTGKISNKPEVVVDDEGTTIIDLSDIIDHDVFHVLMQYMYTGTCDALRPDFQLRSSHLKQHCSSSPRRIDCDPGSGDVYNREELTINERNRHQSAYSVYREHMTGGEGKKKGKKGQKKEKGVQSDHLKAEKRGPLSAVRQVVEEAKKFGIKSLAKRLDNVKMIDGRLSNFGPAVSPLSFHRTNHLSDVILESEEGTQFPCHKCVLSARLDYFQSMLGSGWMEASTNEPLKMSMPASILDLLLDYLYMDQVPKLDGCQDLELLCNTVVIADQLFVTRLKDMCEIALVDLVTLRNVAELLEFASMYQAKQLKASCHQFICLNLASLVESGSLEPLDQHVLEDLSTAYKQTLPYTRFIKPSTNAPDFSHIDPNPPDDNASHQDSTSTPAQPKSWNPTLNDFEALARKAKAKRKGRRRTSSTGKQSSMSISESCDDASISQGNKPDVLPRSDSCSEALQDMSISSPADVSSNPEDQRTVSPTPVDQVSTEALMSPDKVMPPGSVDGMYALERKHKSEGNMANRKDPVKVAVQKGDQEIKGEKNDHSSGSTKTWSWASPKSPVTGLRDIMQSQSDSRSHTSPQASTHTAQTNATGQAAKAPSVSTTSPLPLSPTLSPTQRMQPSSRGHHTPMGKKSQKQRKKEAALIGGGTDEKRNGGGERRDGPVAGYHKPVSCPWAKVTSPAQPSQVSFRDLQAQDRAVESIWDTIPSSPEKRTSASRKIR